jgi:ABC-2 type transport system ATP-binding protein
VSAIVLKNVTKAFGRNVAVDDLSLSVEPGQVFAFLGPNGAGKTTTIKMMVGLLLPDRGNVQICGHVMGTDGREAKALLAYVPDQPFLYEKLSGREFLEFVGRMYHIPDAVAARRIAEYTEVLRLDGFLDQLSEGYSHGMKQKIVLAAALLHEPQVLIVDEPMVGLDPRSIRVVKQLFLERARMGHTVFMTTHTLEVAEALADRIAIIHRGRIVAEGTLEDLRRQRDEQHRLEDIFLQLTEEAEEAPGVERANFIDAPREGN